MPRALAAGIGSGKDAALLPQSAATAGAMLAALLLAAATPPAPDPRDDRCARASALRSVDTPAPSGGPTRHAIQNGLATPLSLAWIDYQGKPLPIATIAPGGFTSLETHAGHVFVLADPRGRCRAIVRADTGRGGSYVGTSRYRPVALRGWDVSVDMALSPRKAPARAALAILEAMLREIEASVPAAGLARVRRTPIFLHDHAGPGGMFHPGADWLVAHGRTVEMTRAIEVSDASLFPHIAREQPAALLHEFAHALYFRLTDAERAEIDAAYARARAVGLYGVVKRGDGSDRPAYAATNAAEYFAETTEALYGRNDFFPFTRDELVAYDPEGARLVDRLWR